MKKHGIHIFSRLTYGDFAFCSLLVLVCMCLAEMRATQSPDGWLTHVVKYDFRGHLGAEYDAIAQALRKGRGFSDPFYEETGPTAWMPPVLPYLTAALYWQFDDDRQSVVTTIICLQGLSVLFTACIVVSEARRLGLALCGYVLTTAFFIANFHELFQKTHDVWMCMLLVNLLWLGLVVMWRHPKREIRWGVGGGLLALCSPVLGASWALLTAGRWGQIGFQRRDWRAIYSIAICGFVSVLVVVPWTIRNKQVFDRWLPIKSNGMFEVWQSFCLDDDGVLDGSTTASHPFASNKEIRQKYRQLGEIRFVDFYAQEVKDAYVQDSLKYPYRVANRFVAATIFYTSHDLADERYPLAVAFAKCVFPLPFVAMLVLVALSTKRDRTMWAAMSIYAIDLVPYILVSYYERYASPLIGLKIMIVLHAIDLLASPHRRLLK